MVLRSCVVWECRSPKAVPLGPWKCIPPHYHDKFQLRLWQNEKGCRNGRKLTCKHQTNLNRSFTGGIFISIPCKFSCRTFCCWVSLSQSYPSEHLHQRRKSTIFWTTLPRSQAHPHNNSPLMAWRQIFQAWKLRHKKKAQVQRNSHKKIAKILELLAKSGDASWGKQDWNDLLGRDSDKNQLPTVNSLKSSLLHTRFHIVWDVKINPNQVAITGRWNIAWKSFPESSCLNLLVITVGGPLQIFINSPQQPHVFSGPVSASLQKLDGVGHPVRHAG